MNSLFSSTQDKIRHLVRAYGLWVAVLAVILAAGLASALWPDLSARLGGEDAGRPARVRARDAVEPVHLSLPGFVPADKVPDVLLSPSGDALELPPWLAFGVISAVVLGPVVVAGILLALVFSRLDDLASRTKTDEAFQASLAALEERESQAVKAAQAARPAKSMPAHNMPRWSVASTNLIAILFMVFLGVTISEAIYPHGEIQIGSVIWSAPGLFALAFALVTGLVLFRLVRQESLAQINQSDYEPIPWDLVYVIVTGFIFVILGTGLIVWVRSLAG